MYNYFMKLFKHFTYIFFINLFMSSVNGEAYINNNLSQIPYRTSNQFQNSILNQNRFNMNHSFSIMSSMNKGLNQTTGIYSNYISYNISNKTTIKSSFHLFQNQSNSLLPNRPNAQMGYEIELNYKISQNSELTINLGNYKNNVYNNY